LFWFVSHLFISLTKKQLKNNKAKEKKYLPRYMGDAPPPSWMLLWLNVES
jgi:hypothetical protein